jgi:hypothetical protein
MMASRGMGAINPKKMPGKKVIHRKDDPNKVAVYKDGGKVKKMAEGGKTLAEQAKEKIAEYNNSNGGGSSNDAVPYVQAMGGKDKYGIGGGGKAGFRKKLDENTDISAYLEAGGFKPKKGEFQGKIMGGGVTYNKRFAEGGKTKSKVNEAGNYTKPELRKRIFNSVKAAAIVGTGAGQWSARKAQVMAKRYKAAGGGYRD